MIHSLDVLPIEADRSYYLYILDYGWDEPIRKALYDNFGRMADLASQSHAIVMRGTVGDHFSDEVFSWHHINGQPSEGILPAVLITTLHQQHFRSRGGDDSSVSSDDNLLLIPLRPVCKDAGVVPWLSPRPPLEGGLLTATSERWSDQSARNGPTQRVRGDLRFE